MANEGIVCFIVYLIQKTYGFVKYLSPYIIIEKDMLTLLISWQQYYFFPLEDLLKSDNPTTVWTSL